MLNNSNENQNKKKIGLGRGIGSLLGGSQDIILPTTADILSGVGNKNITSTTSNQANQPKATNAVETVVNIPSDARVWQMSIEKLSSGQFQPRKQFDKASLDELSQSIKQSGILQPIIARKTTTGKFEIIAGERRWRAAQQAGLHEVPVIIKSLEDKEALELAIVENIQREDLNPIEEAEGYSKLNSQFGYTQQQIADRVGKERATVANSLRLLQLAPQVKEMLINSIISVGHAKVLLSITDHSKQVEIAKKIVSNKLNVRKAEKLISQMSSQEGPESILSCEKSNVTNRLINGLSDELQKLLGTKVAIDYTNSKGKISVYFYSDDELTSIIDRLKRGCQN